MGNSRSKQSLRDNHNQRSRDSLTRNIANTEKEFLITDMVIVQITTHFLRRFQLCVNINIITVGESWERLQQHRTLYIAGNT